MSLTTEELQKMDMGREVELFELDCSTLGTGAPVLWFTRSYDASNIVWDGDTYDEAPIEAEGFDRSTEGALPNPILRVGNASRLLAANIDTWDDLIGCTLTRTLVFEQFLDGEVSADTTAYHRKDVYLVEQKTRQNPVFIEFRLAAALDQEGQPIPRRSMLRRICPRRYRQWTDVTPDPNEFTSYEQQGGCPYRGSTYAGPVTAAPYDVDGTTGPYYLVDDTVTTTPSEDRCGKTLNSCRTRYPNLALPFGAFPGLGDARG